MKTEIKKLSKSEYSSFEAKMKKDIRLKELLKTLKENKHLTAGEREILRIICEVDYGIKIS